ncbi:hypothetical protein GCM10007216_15160 [Thalassobacillus devorans]|uniref:MurNAc-LAA domain-containing protein n=1 Tax=Thalassobacillus devorans TaxID=279813 RepID=A0ABQ1NUW9_9BACI|nr:peptidoglycan-binding protein [Thalassobacillus devorans]NIK28541.1 mannosyl-glycoprotein endo-beta-N-acetylglucosaminidase [Thalassobacillus devorans]GGC85414.1 hypothetical protein GCM10007216_15160 [Thalassobacillus devorans]
MKLIRVITMFTALCLIFHFSPQVILASDEEKTEEANTETVEDEQANDSETEADEEGEGTDTEETTEEEADSDDIETSSDNVSEEEQKSTDENDDTTEEDTIEEQTPTDEAEDQPTYEQDDVSDHTSNEKEEKEDPAADEATAQDEEVKEEEKAEPENTDEEATTFSVQSTQHYQLGDRHPAIVEIKEKLNAIGFGGIKETELFGSFTEQRIEQFQQNYALPVNGAADDATMKKLDEVFNSSFQSGKKDDRILKLKEQLNQTQFSGITVTDYFGSFTEKRVKELQSHLNMKTNGIADALTRERLQQLANQQTMLQADEPSEFKEGDRDEAIKDMKRKLNSIGFGKILVTELYGSYTTKKVTQFQNYYGLNESGDADAETLEQIDDVYNSPFQLGERHNETSEWKEKLNEAGFGGIRVTDYFGEFTEKRVKELQRTLGLIDNGIIDNVTQAKLDELLAETSFQQGDRDSRISDMKEKLNAIGFAGITVTDYYGAFTAKRVGQFQDYYGLPETGEANQITLDKLDEVYHSPFQQGKRHEDLSGLKEKLNKLGFSGITVTDYFGSFTEKRVKEFQEFYGLKVNGIIEEYTQAKIDELYHSPLQVGKRHSALSEVKENLNALGYGGIIVSDYFGSFTEKRVKEFQRDYNLPVSGIVDPLTRETIASNVVKIFLDPGHGDHDPGGQGYGLDEKDVVLDIALRTANSLNRSYKGFNIKFSREDDTFIPLEERSEMANSWGADYFVSYHTNAWLGKGSGFETYIHDGNVSKETEKRQEDIHNYLIDRIDVGDRGMKQADYNVLRNTDMPSILLEYMFIDNLRENEMLKDSNYRTYLGEITAEAIAHSFGIGRK